MTPWAAPNYAADGQQAGRHLIRNPALAALLRQLARRGPEHFYTGAAARALVQTSAPRRAIRRR